MYNPNIPYNDIPSITSLSIDVGTALTKAAEDARVAIEVLRYAVKSFKGSNILLGTLALQEAKASSNVENILTTNDDLYRGVVFENFTEEAREVSNYKDALIAGQNFLKDKGMISISDIEHINAYVNKKQKGVRKNLPGFDGLTRIANKKASGEQEIIYTPPHGKELLQELLIDMLEYIYNDDSYFIHPLIKIALAHYQFESIHPFSDGNGRTGRILNVLFLCQKGYLGEPILYASSYINKNKNEYYTLLRKAKETARYEEFIMYMLTSFKETAEDTLRIVENIKELIARYTKEENLGKLKGQYKPLCDTVELVFKKTYVRISDVVDLGIHRQTAAVYLEQLVDEGLLAKEKVGRENIYKNIKLLELFERDTEVTA